MGSNVAILLTLYLWPRRIFPTLPRARLTNFYRDASSALFQRVNQWLNLTSSRANAFRYGRKNTNPALTRIELTTSALAQVCRLPTIDHSGDEGTYCIVNIHRERARLYLL
ncbi:unnamed protein product [Ascophyllum nodosum]